MAEHAYILTPYRTSQEEERGKSVVQRIQALKRSVPEEETEFQGRCGSRVCVHARRGICCPIWCQSLHHMRLPPNTCHKLWTKAEIWQSWSLSNSSAIGGCTCVQLGEGTAQKRWYSGFGSSTRGGGAGASLGYHRTCWSRRRRHWRSFWRRFGEDNSRVPTLTKTNTRTLEKTKGSMRVLRAAGTFVTLG